MKFLVLLGLCLVCAFVAGGPIEPATILRYDSNNDGAGLYNFAFETSDGIKREEQSEVVNAGDPEKAAVIVRGTYSYTGPDGVVYSIRYVADENGFQPQGAHIPGGSELKPPPVGHSPALIASLLG